MRLHLTNSNKVRIHLDGRKRGGREEKREKEEERVREKREVKKGKSHSRHRKDV